MTEEEKASIELDIEAKYVDKTEKEFLRSVTYVECLFILDCENKYCDDIKKLSLLKIADIINKQKKEIEELKIWVDEYDDLRNKIIKKRTELKNIIYSGNADDFGNIRRKYALEILEHLC